MMRTAAGDIKRVSLELGGKSANLIFADADLEKAAARRSSASSATRARTAAPAAACWSSGRSTTRSSSASSSARAIASAIPLDEATEMGSLISREHREKVDG